MSRDDGFSPPRAARRVRLRSRHRARRVDRPRHDQLVRSGPVPAQCGRQGAHVAVEPRGRALGEIPIPPAPRRVPPAVAPAHLRRPRLALSSTFGVGAVILALVRVAGARSGLDGDPTERIERGDDAARRRRRVHRRDVGGRGGGRGAAAGDAVGHLPPALDRRVFVRPPQLKLRVGEEALGEGIFAPFRHRRPPRASDDDSGGRETGAPPPLKNR